MTGTFSSLNGALSALRYHQVVMDTASGNIANVATDGYARRRVAGEAVGAPAQTAMWSRYDGGGDGVRVAGLERMVDAFLDARARREHGQQTFLDVRQGVLERVEAGLGEPGDHGVAAALIDFRKGWQDLANNPASGATRSQVLARAGSLADAIRIQSRNVDAEAAGQRLQLTVKVADVNVLASDLASTNRSIAVARLQGSDAGTLLDARDALAMRISELTGAQATVRADGGFDVMLNGEPLVVGQVANRIEIASGVTPEGEADGSPVTFAVVSDAGTSTVAGPVSGALGSVARLLDETLPAYRGGLDVIARTLADQVNAQHVAGYDRAGAAGEPLFVYDAANVAGSLAVAALTPDQIAASSQPGGGLDAGNALALSTAVAVDGDYQRLVSGFGAEVASTRRLALNQRTLTGQVDASREQLSGVSLDEEMVSMLTAQRAYEAAARVMTTVDSVLDTLINRTGMTR